MKCFKIHTQNRFKEKVLPSYQAKRLKLSELTDDDYFLLCELCKNDNTYPALAVRNNTNDMHRKNIMRKIVNFKGCLIWCVFHKKNYFVRTVFPLKKKELKTLRNVNDCL